MKTSGTQLLLPVLVFEELSSLRCSVVSMGASWSIESVLSVGDLLSTDTAPSLSIHLGFHLCLLKQRANTNHSVFKISNYFKNSRSHKEIKQQLYKY